MSNRSNTGITLKLNSVKDDDVRMNLSMAFTNYEVAKKLEVTEIRAAARAMANATKASAEASIAQLDFLIKAGETEELEAVSTEANWLTRRNRDGEIVLECLMTENDMQTAAKAQTRAIKAQSQQIIEKTGGEEEGNSDLFGSNKE